jgi:tight adherence protein B
MSPAPTPTALAWAAALCAAALFLRASGPDPAAVHRRAFGLLGEAESRARRPAGKRLGESVGWVRRALAGRPGVLCLPVGLVLGLMTGSLLPVVAGAVGVPLVGRAMRRRAERAATERGVAAVGALCGTVAGDLRAGRPPHAALADAVESAGWARVPELAGAALLLLSAARFGGDVPRALRVASRVQEGTRGLAAVAACWQVAVDGGAGLAAALDRVAAALRAEADQREDLRAQLAGPRSTAVLLALLPLFGLVLGTGLGANPSAVLLHTPAGLFCLLAGGALEWAGLAWTARIIRAAEDGPGGGHPKARNKPMEQSQAAEVAAGRRAS